MHIYKSISLMCFCLLGFLNSILAEQLPPSVANYLKTAEISEDGALPARGKGLQEFQQYLIGNWREVFSNINAVAPTDPEKRKIVAACEVLDDSEYLDFLAVLQNLLSKKIIGVNVVEKAIYPSQARAGYLVLNWQNPTVRAFLETVQAQSPADGKLNRYAGDVLSGKEEPIWKKYLADFGLIKSGASSKATSNRAAAPTSKTSMPFPTSTPADSSTEMPRKQLLIWPWVVTALVLTGAIVFSLRRKT